MGVDVVAVDSDLTEKRPPGHGHENHTVPWSRTVRSTNHDRVAVVLLVVCVCHSTPYLWRLIFRTVYPVRFSTGMPTMLPAKPGRRGLV